MIKKLFFPIIALLLLSSCATKYSLIKRKHGKGYYVSVTKNNNSPKEKLEAKNTVAKNKPTQKTETISSFSENLAVAPTKKSNSETLKNNSQSNVAIHKPATPGKTVDINKFIASTVNTVNKTSLKIKPIALTHKNKLSKSDSDLNLLIMIILCLFIFINLIPVYLHDSKNVTLNFWLTLILDFTYIGGVILALLVVLDIVNLA